jgi:hypothetical protein
VASWGFYIYFSKIMEKSSESRLESIRKKLQQAGQWLIVGAWIGLQFPYVNQPIKKSLVGAIPNEQMSLKFLAAGIIGESSTKGNEILTEKQQEALTSLVEEKVYLNQALLELFHTELDMEPALKYALLKKAADRSWSGVRNYVDYPQHVAADYYHNTSVWDVFRFSEYDHLQKAVGSFNYTLVEPRNTQDVVQIIIEDTFDTNVTNAEGLDKLAVAWSQIANKGVTAAGGKELANNVISLFVRPFDLSFELVTNDPRLLRVTLENQSRRRELYDWLDQNSHLECESGKYAEVIDDVEFTRSIIEQHNYDRDDAAKVIILKNKLRYQISASGVSLAHMLLIDESGIVAIIAGDMVRTLGEKEVDEITIPINQIAQEITGMSAQQLTELIYLRYGIENHP